MSDVERTDGNFVRHDLIFHFDPKTAYRVHYSICRVKTLHWCFIGAVNAFPSPASL